MKTNDPTLNDSLRSKNQRSSRFWTESEAITWAKVRTEMMREWRNAEETAERLESRVAEKAIALGHGARHAWTHVQEWGAGVETKLEAEWKKTAEAAYASWDKVRRAVKHGWDRAKDAAVKAGRSS